jgi:hypothetical protein
MHLEGERWPPRVSEEAVRQVEAARKSVRSESRELQIPETTVWPVLRSRTLMKPYKSTMIYKLESEDCPKRKNFCETLQSELDNEETIAQRLLFSDNETKNSMV